LSQNAVIMDLDLVPDYTDKWVYIHPWTL
jgi:hypothetical protein